MEAYLKQSRAAELNGDRAELKQATLAEMTGFLKSVLGPRLTALLVGVTDTRTINEWISGAARPAKDQEQRLRVAFDIVQNLVQEESPLAVRSWFLGMNPDLNDRAPATVFDDEPDLVVEAARTFLATG